MKHFWYEHEPFQTMVNGLGLWASICRSSSRARVTSTVSCINDPIYIIHAREICGRENKNNNIENVHGSKKIIFEMMWKCGSRTKSWYMIQTCNIQYTSVYTAVYGCIRLYTAENIFIQKWISVYRKFGPNDIWMKWIWTIWREPEWKVYLSFLWEEVW